MSVKNFNFGARKHVPKPKPANEAERIPFTLEEGGPVYHMHGSIDENRYSAVSLLFSRAEAKEDGQGQIDHMVTMLEMLFTDETVTALLKRLADPGDYFNGDLLGELVEKATEEHSGDRPTTSPRTSSGSRRPAGRKSTGSSSSKASTSGRSRSTAS